MTDWPQDMEVWIDHHPDHILYLAAQLRYRESLEALKRLPLDVVKDSEWVHALMAIRAMMQYYRRIHGTQDFDQAAEQTFKVYVERRLKGCRT